MCLLSHNTDRHPHDLPSAPDIGLFARSSHCTARVGASDLAAAVPCVWNGSKTFGCTATRDISSDTSTAWGTTQEQTGFPMPLARLSPRPELWAWINMLQDGISPSRSRSRHASGNQRGAQGAPALYVPFPETKPQTEFRYEKKSLKCLCLVSLSPDPSAQLGFQNASVPSPLVRHRGRIGPGPASFRSLSRGGLDGPRWATKHAGQPNPINPQRDNAGERDSRSSVCTHPPHWVPGRGESGGKEGGESAQMASTGAASGGEETPHRPSHSHDMP